MANSKVVLLRIRFVEVLHADVTTIENHHCVEFLRYRHLPWIGANDGRIQRKQNRKRRKLRSWIDGIPETYIDLRKIAYSAPSGEMI